MSPISQFLNLPTMYVSTPKSRKSSVSRARVLTSAEAISLMEAKEKKKQEEIEMKEARKRERAEKKQQREEEAKIKAEEKERRVAERKKAQAEKEEEKKRKAAAKEAETKRKAEQRSLRSSNKENVASDVSNVPSGSDGSSPTPDVGNTDLETGDQNECAVCLGRYEDDITDGILQKEWVRCTNIENCGLWMHSDCLSTEGNSYVCYICNIVFK